MYDHTNSYDHFKNREQDLIHEAKQERLAQEILSNKPKSNPTLSQMGHLLVKVGNHLIESYSDSDLTIPKMPAAATGNQA